MDIPTLRIQRQLLEIQARLLLRKKEINQATDPERKADLGILLVIEKRCEAHLEKKLELSKLLPVIELYEAKCKW